MTISRLGIIALFIALCAPARGEDALPSWNNTPAKQAIIAFVDKVTKADGPDYVKIDERIAVFDNDGTLWTEWPLYTQGYFALQRLKELAPKHPEWRKRQPFKAALSGDLQTLAESGARGVNKIIGVTHAGGSPEEFQGEVSQWLATAEHPKFKAHYDRLVYQPMLELLAYLRAKGFKTFIVSGGGVEFVRAFAERVYGVPPEQIVGSSIVTTYDVVKGTPRLTREAKIDFIDDGAGKPVGINQFIGRRPIAAFGNSDGDFQMLEWTTAGAGPRFGLIIHHDDATREAAYDRASPVGRLDRGLDEAGKRGWTLVSMKNDWKTIFPPQK